MESIHTLGQIMIGIIFVFAGTYNISRREILVGVMRIRKIPYPKLCVHIGMSIAFVGGILIILNQHIRLAVLALSLFILFATFLYHDFWNKVGEERKMKVISVMNNVALLGALMLIL